MYKYIKQCISAKYINQLDNTSVPFSLIETKWLCVKVFNEQTEFIRFHGRCRLNPFTNLTARS